MNRVHVIRSLSVVAVVLALAGMPGIPALSPSAAFAQTAQPIKSVSDVKNIVVSTLPANTIEITNAMKTAKVGDSVTLHGYVAMSKDAFGDKAATFVLVDESARTGERPANDKLPDTDSGIASASRATLQLVDKSGSPLAFSLRDQHGLKAGAEVFATGTVTTANGTDSLVVNVTSLHIPRAAVPGNLFSNAAPENAKDVSEARKQGTMKKGDQVVLSGRIGGSKEPFVGGRAVFTLMGNGLKACNENPDDNCKHPWDYCCETKKDILANSVTVQVVDTKGQPLRTDMKGRRGLKELTEVVVVGTVAIADSKAVVVNATNLYVSN